MDGPSLGELARRIGDLTTLITGLVTRTEYAGDRRYDDRRFNEVEADIAAIKAEQADLRKTLADGLKALRASLDAAQEKRGGHFRQAIYSGILPSIFVLITVVVTIWTSRG
ncbi:hypothetical protein GT755_12430 [Herbidospora sp. NEAU-GS84]|uniref:Uncharacterized protein n=1 Tax=Herbidospora solisilvae TaxID=2696284 RepID=A0A7C9N0T4_9ACTN|nr:hypothetical protein [Herbidospora solisilvae]NAS22489.1 hypothetical protein [Herbidospora solisilvae]